MGLFSKIAEGHFKYLTSRIAINYLIFIHKEFPLKFSLKNCALTKKVMKTTHFPILYGLPHDNSIPFCIISSNSGSQT